MLTVYVENSDTTGGTGNLVFYTFSSRDICTGAMGTDAGESLVHIKMTQGDPLSWSLFRRVSIMVDGPGASLICVAA